MLYTEPYQVFVPVKGEPEKDQWLKSERGDIFTQLSAKVNNIVGAESMFNVFEQAKEMVSSMDDSTICIFAHDDLKILSSAESIVEIMETVFSGEDTGFIGLAGCRRLRGSAVWWDGLKEMNPNHLDKTNLRGMILHGNSIFEMHPTYYGNFGQCQVLDGVFLATTKKTLDSLNVSKPKYFTGDWDFYDIYLTFQADMLKLKNFAVPILAVHQSMGDGILSDGWKENREAFVQKFGKFLG